MRRISILAAIAAAMLSCTSVNDNSINVVPYPNDVEVKAGTFDAAGAEFHLSEGLDEGTVNIIKAFAAQLSLTSGKECTTDNNGSRDGFIFTLNPDMPEEAYSLKVSRKAVEVEAATLRGFNYAIQTIKQMLPAEIFGKEEAAGLNWTLPCVEINDEPRFSYRGMHMDVVRHFFDMNMVKRYLDIMEVHKLNTLHWHITDDQGWRIEIKKYPKLTEIGSIRKETIIGHIFESDEYDGTPYGEGCWFSQEQIETIAQAAEDHRASGTSAPRSIYGMLVAEADRVIVGETIIRRTIQYGFNHYPGLDREGHISRAISHLHEKYGRGGYLKLWIPWSDNAVQLSALQDIIADAAAVYTATASVYDNLV